MPRTRSLGLNRRSFLGGSVGAVGLSGARFGEGAAMQATPAPESGSFPEGFVWGAATSAYQIEGAVDADGRGPSIWDTFCRQPGRIRDGSNGDVACDHYHRWRDDLALMSELGLGAYRFSVAWPRVLPEGRGLVNEAGLAFYDALVDGLLAVGIEPWVTLYHWDLPQPLEDAGGWPERATIEAFAAYVDVVTRRLGDRVKRWITINEPWVISYLGYEIGAHAPGRRNRRAALAAAHNVLLAHGAAVPIVRANSPAGQVGITLDLMPAYPATDAAEDRAGAAAFDEWRNRRFLDPLYGRGYPAALAARYGDDLPAAAPEEWTTIATPTDFLGVNYYQPAFLEGSAAAPLGFAEVDVDLPRTAMDWLVYPDGLTDVLVRLGTDYSTGPLYVTENGAAYDDPAPVAGQVADPERTAYLRGHLAAGSRAIAAGAPLTGYFVWSLLDNFEWAFGYTRRFGIVHVDFATQTRTIKESGEWYAGTIRGS
jgi:beta-glucosidase